MPNDPTPAEVLARVPDGYTPGAWFIDRYDDDPDDDPDVIPGVRGIGPLSYVELRADAERDPHRAEMDAALVSLAPDIAMALRASVAENERLAAQVAAILAELDRRATWLEAECRKGGSCYLERDQALHAAKIARQAAEAAKGETPDAD